MDSAWRDVRSSLRSLLSRPSFTGVAVATLALGIGANATLFALVSGVLLRPLPYRDPQGLVRLWEANQARDNAPEMTSTANLRDWRAQSRSFEAIAAWQRPTSLTLTSATAAVELRASLVTHDYFQVLGIQAARGRVFGDDEGSTGPARVVVVSDGFWRRQLGASAQAVGSTLQLEDEDFTIIGVLPAGVDGPAGVADVSVPIDFQPNEIDRGQTYLQAIARLRPGVSLEQAQADMQAVAARLASTFPETNRGRGILLASLTDATVGSVRRPLLIVLGAVSLVLLVSCANVANLFLLRAAERRPELAIRVALGATRGRILRQLLIEAALVAFGGGVLGLLLAFDALALVKAFGPGQLPRLDAVHVDEATAVFTLLLSLLTAVIVGLVPAREAVRAAASTGLNDAQQRHTSRSSGRAGRLQASLVVSQIALTLVLLFGAGLLGKSLMRLLGVDPGFRSDGVLVARISLGSDYANADSQVAYFRDVTARLRELPGVTAAGAATVLPMNPFGIDFSVPYYRPSEPEPARSAAPKARFRSVTPEYFDGLGIVLRRGRGFSERDRGGSPRVVVVSQTLADQAWPGKDPIGRQLRFFWADWQTYEVVGVVGDLRSSGLGALPSPELFVPHAQQPYLVMNIVVRAAGDATAVAEGVRRTILAADPRQPAHSVTTMDELISDSLARERFTLAWLGALAVVALGLATIGVYSVVSYVAASRSREMALRLALGASRRDVGRIMLGGGAALALAGIAFGLLGSIALGRVLSGLIFDVGATDLPTLAGVCLLLLATTLAAAWIPARRAMRADPMTALREG